MKKIKGKGKKIIIALALVVILLHVVTPSALMAERWSKNDCRDAHIKCGFTALLGSISNPYVGPGLAALCTIGLLWCLEFSA